MLILIMPFLYSFVSLKCFKEIKFSDLLLNVKKKRKTVLGQEGDLIDRIPVELAGLGSLRGQSIWEPQ